MLIHWFLAKKNPLMKIFLVVCETSLNSKYSCVKPEYYITVLNFIYMIVTALLFKSIFLLEEERSVPELYCIPKT